MKEASPSLKILKICSSRAWGGLELHMTNLCEELRDRGHEVIPACYPGSRIDQRLRGLGFEPIPLRIRSYLHPLQIYKLAKTIRKSGIDLIHSDYSKDLWTIIPAMKLSADRPVVLIKHIGTQKPKRDWFHRWIYRNVSHVIAISTVIKDNIIATHPIDQSRVSVLHNGVSLEKFNQQNVDRAAVRVEFKIAPDEVVIGIVGRLQVAKGYLEFLKMAAAISPEFPNTKFMIVGEATHGRQAEADMILNQIDELGLREKVIYTGYRDDVPSLLAAMDMFVFPSRAEAFGLVLIEAMAMQLPVVACRSDGVLDIVLDHETGLLFTPKNVDELIGAVSDLLQHPQKRLSFGKAGLARVKKFFSENQILDELENLYRRLLQRV